MSLGIAIEIEDNASPAFLRVAAAVQEPDVRKVMGRAIATELRRHFSRLDQERPNRLGGKRTHFYGEVRRAVQQPELVAGDGVKVAIDHVGIAQRYFGGTITPEKSGGWLTIPARSEAHGMRAREFDDLHFVFFRAGLAALVQNEQTSLGGRVHGSVTARGRRKKQTIGGGIFYWLKKSVTQRGDKSVLPDEASLQSAALDAAGDYLDERMHP